MLRVGRWGRRTFQRHFDRFEDRVDRVLDRFAYFAAGNCGAARQTRNQVTPAHIHRALGADSIGRPDLELGFFCSTVTDRKIVSTAHVVDDRLVDLVSGDAYGAACHDSAKRNHRNFRRAAADIDDHRARRLRDRQSCADRRRHRLFDGEGFTRARFLCRFGDGAFFYFSDAGRHTDYDTR